MLKDRLGQAMYGINSHRLKQVQKGLRVGDRLVYRFAFPMRLGKGHYSVALSLSRLDSHLDRNFEWRDCALIFHVVNSTREEDFVGYSWLDARASIEHFPSDSLVQRSGEHSMMRLLVECTYVFEHPQVNSGIQRVVRNVIRHLEDAEGGVECIPVAFINGRMHRVLHLAPLSTRGVAAGTAA